MGSQLSTIQIFVLVISAVAGGMTTVSVLAQIYRKTIGRRRDLAGRIARLGTGAQLSFFEDVLDGPPAIRNRAIAMVRKQGSEDLQEREELELIESIFIDREYYIQTLSTLEDRVLGYSVSARGRRFRPIISGSPRPSPGAWLRWHHRHGRSRYPRLFRVRLGKTTFAHLGDQGMAEFGHGASWYAYSENRWFGRPAWYQDFAFTASSAIDHESPKHIAELVRVKGIGKGRETSRPFTEMIDDITAIRNFRSDTPITTVSVMIQPLSWESWPVFFGPVSERVRTIP